MIEFPAISPEIFSISVAGFEFALRWYAVSYIAGFGVALVIMRSFLARQTLWRYSIAPMQSSDADDLLTWLIVGVILGGRLGYVVFYNFDYYLSDPLQVLRLWDGGMSFHGGFLGVVVALAVYCSRNGVPFVAAADLLALASPPGLLFGRVANFINAELWGRPTDAPWGVIFPGERAQYCPGIDGVCARHPSQLYEAGLEGLALFLIVIVVAMKGGLSRSGLLSGLFLFGYGISRFIVEYYRVPDPQFFSESNPYGFALAMGNFGVTMGQVLSLPMIFAGCCFIYFAVRRTS